jgi:glycosyl transferase family 25
VFEKAARSRLVVAYGRSRVSGMIPVIVISLPRSAERRAFMRRQFDALAVGFTFFDAFDGSTTRVLKDRYFRPLLPAEMGCAESHLSVIRTIAESQDEFACVLEDDAELSAGLPALLDRATLAHLPRFDVLRLCANRGSPFHLARRLAAIWRPNIYAMLRPGDGTIAQIYSRPGAQRIIAQMHRLAAPIDWALYEESRVPGLRVLEFRPYPIGYSALQSEIGDRPLEKSQPPWERAIHRFTREARAFANFWRAWGWRGMAALRVMPN